MGATGVMIGRPYAMALACGGTQGVIDCIDNLMAELELTMALSGCASLQTFNSSLFTFLSAEAVAKVDHSSLVTHPWNTR
jgi:isopentenyl diphosphate isomerase/L-lactate dehydrogenase-like FMN-dependent dehydrogenase